MIQKNMFNSSQRCTICGLLVATHRGKKKCFHWPHRKGCCHINRPLGHTHIQKPGVALLAWIHLVSADYVSFFGEFSFSWAGLFFVFNVSLSFSPSGVLYPDWAVLTCHISFWVGDSYLAGLSAFHVGVLTYFSKRLFQKL